MIDLLVVGAAVLVIAAVLVSLTLVAFAIAARVRRWREGSPPRDGARPPE